MDSKYAIDFTKRSVYIPLIVLFMVAMGGLFLIIPYFADKVIVSNTAKNSETLVAQIRMFRSYYTSNVLPPIKKHTNLKINFDHKMFDDTVPLPATTVHDLAALFTENSDLEVKMYSAYPFPNRKDRLLDKYEQESLRFFEENSVESYVRKDVINGQAVVRYAAADFLTSDGCVSCHNGRKDTPKSDWKVGDMRGVIEVITPISDELSSTNVMRKWIIIFMMFMTVVIGLYLWILLYRSHKKLGTINQDLSVRVASSYEELQRLNEELEVRVQEEVQKNRDKDKVLFQQARLASLGEMIGNISHQWRQPLNNLGLVMQKYKIVYEHGKVDQAFIQEQDHKGKQLIQFMSQTIDDFKNFFKPDKEKRAFNIVQGIQETYTILETTFERKDIHFTINATNDTIEAVGFPNEFQQVILNLIKNAVDVLEELEQESKEIVVTVIQKDTFVEVIVEDNGKGIAEDTLDKVFDPYFTTKHQSVGTGLGLYMSKAIIEEHMEGSIHVFNNEKGGASFVIKLPKA
jgi:C4-dicarboxylate-specific signal transduction histidine kinase